MTLPTPTEIRATRESAGISTRSAAAMVHRTVRNWQQWESGERTIDPAAWELFTLKLKLGKLAG